MKQFHKKIQGNILKSHGRDFQVFILLQFKGNNAIVKKWISKLDVTTFEEQLTQAELYRSIKSNTNNFISFYLSNEGYNFLDFSITPNDVSFNDGFTKMREVLGQTEDWDDRYSKTIHAALLFANDDREELHKSIDLLKNQISEFADIILIEEGATIRDDEGFGREPFGFRDGISNPIFLKQDLEKHPKSSENQSFDVSAPNELVLVKDPYLGDALGSFVSVAKFEQNIKAFVTANNEQKNSSDTNLEAHKIFGRDRNGTPLHLDKQSTDELKSNNWDYTNDSQGQSCPYHSHIRKMNDRSESLKKGKQYNDESFKRIARRGFTFFENDQDFNSMVKNAKASAIQNTNVGKVGTYFISYQASIHSQFEKIINENAFNPNYFENNTGIDALLGNASIDDQSKTSNSKFLFLRGGLYLYAPPIEFLKNIEQIQPVMNSHRLGNPSSNRTSYLRQQIIERGFSNRKSEWFTKDMLGNILDDNPELSKQPVILRKALASKKMLEALVNEKFSKKTLTYTIDKGELIVGVVPMGSVGLGKVFPKYLTEEERRASSYANRDEASVFGHTVPNFKRILIGGLKTAIDKANEALNDNTINDSKKAFYTSTIIVCESVISYAKAFGELADQLKTKETDKQRISELDKISRICSEIPMNPAKTFHEALQCVWFLHLAQSAFCAFNSLGRLDQVLNEYLLRDLKEGVISREEAVELIECFLIKCAHRLNLNPATLKDQDNLSYGTGIGTRPIYLDQIASCNNFIQNIVLGGVKPDGSDGSNETTYVFLEALGNIGLATPTVNARVGNNSSSKYLDAVDKAIRHAGNGHPILFNEDTVIEGLKDSGIPEKEANDFALAGCWEPMLHGKNSFIFGMVNMLRVVECALNEGMFFNPDRQFLTGQKQSIKSPKANEYSSFDELMQEVKKHLQFFSDKVAVGTCSFFQFPSSMTPTPFLSVLLDGCLERGMDQSEGGADFNIVSNIAFAIPNAVNALANIKKYVFEEKKWTLEEVRLALELNWGLSKIRDAYDPIEVEDEDLKQKLFVMRRTFLESEYKFGNNHPFVENISSHFMNMWYDCAKKSENLAKDIYLTSSKNAKKLRLMSNYPADELRETMRKDFNLQFTIGTGTFGQYSSMGKGVSASADGRMAHEALAPNCSPTAGTANNGLEGLFKSLKNLKLARFGGAAVTDIRINGVNQTPDYFKNLILDWVKHNGNMLTVSVLSTSDILKMIELVEVSSQNPNEVHILKEYADRFCRVGGWNSGFICLPKPQQRDHLLRATFNKENI